MPRYILTGYIQRAAKVSVEADSPEEAIQQAEAGNFIIYEEYSGADGFTFDGGDDHIEVDHIEVDEPPNPDQCEDCGGTLDANNLHTGDGAFGLKSKGNLYCDEEK